LQDSNTYITHVQQLLVADIIKYWLACWALNASVLLQTDLKADHRAAV
jgi:hypothetical protein